MSLRDDLAIHMPALKRYARALCGNAHDADDLFQDCLERALANEHGWRGTNLKAWLFTLMTNRHRTILRTGRSRPRSAPLDEAADLVMDEAQSDPQARDRIVRALGLISEEGRATLLLVALEGYAYAEVATILDVPIGTVMSRLSRARRQLSEILKGDNILPMRSRK
ncbi:MAG: RNA polymerase sigma factor [Hyphomicrobiaceae bacterium]|nr:RNA polymerase sigma factor [Hyphomicrobiaceae bacterium]